MFTDIQIKFLKNKKPGQKTGLFTLKIQTMENKNLNSKYYYSNAYKYNP
jgi:hypothetical protein